MVRFVGKYFNLPLLVFASPLSWDMLDVGTAVGIFYCAVNWVKMRGYEWISARCVSNMTTYTTNTMQQRGESNIRKILYSYLHHSKDLDIMHKGEFRSSHIITKVLFVSW